MEGDGDGGCGQFITLCLCRYFLRGGLLTLYPCSSMGSHPWETVLHEVLQRGSFPQVAVLHKLPQRGSIPTGCSPSGTGCSSLGPPWGHKFCQQTCSSMGSSVHGATDPARSLLQHGAPHGLQPPSAIHLLWCGVLHGPQVEICSTVDLHGLQGQSLPHHGLLHGLQGNLCSSAWSTSSPLLLH